MKKILILFLLLASCLMFACKAKANKEKKLVIVEGFSSNMVVGDEASLDIKFVLKKENEIERKNYNPTFSTSDAMVVRIEDGKVKAYKEGSAVITISAKEDSEYNLELRVVVVKKNESEVPTKLTLTAGEITKLNKTSEKALNYVSKNEKIVQTDGENVLAISEGKTEIVGYNNNNEEYKVEVEVNKYVAPKVTDADLAYVRQVMEKMTIEEKVGQMFIGSASGTEITKNIRKAIEEYHLGNFLFMGYNCEDPKKTGNFSIALQNLFMEANSIPAFICIDQETGTVNRMNTGATRFLGNMAIGATNNPHNSYLVGEAVGAELKNYGINFDLAPVLDVNNNPDNPIINCRSYGDNPVHVSAFGMEMINGLKSQNVMSCAKHFPGHGNTATDSHLALPLISASLDELYKIELAPFIASIYTGIDAIMTTHIVFSALDTKYPATLSKQVLTGLLRENLGYQGLIVTDGMEMSAIAKNYGVSQAAILAINAGADILCYTSVTDPMKAIPDVLQAIAEGEISMDRINDAVERILLKKLKYNLFEDYLIDENFSVYDVKEHSLLNLELAKQAVTVYTNNFSGLDKTKDTIIMSSSAAISLGYSGNENSFAYYCSKYLKEKGMAKCDYDVISGISNSNKDSFIEEALNYSQIVIAIDSANAAQISFVNELCEQRSDVVVVALKLPYDYNSYKNVNTFIAIYDRTPIMVEALTRLMASEYEPTGKCPVKLNK